MNALDLEPGLAAAHAWLGEIDLRAQTARLSLERAVELDGSFSWARLYLAAARLQALDAAGAAAELEGFLRLEPASGLGWLLLGLSHRALGRGKPEARAFEDAIKRNCACSAAY